MCMHTRYDNFQSINVRSLSSLRAASLVRFDKLQRKNDFLARNRRRKHVRDLAVIGEQQHLARHLVVTQLFNVSPVIPILASQSTVVGVSYSRSMLSVRPLHATATAPDVVVVVVLILQIILLINT